MSVTHLNASGRRKPGASHRNKPISEFGSDHNKFFDLDKARADAVKRSKDTEKHPHGVDVFFDKDYRAWFTAPMWSSRGLDLSIGECRYIAGKPAGRQDTTKVFKDFGPKVGFSNMGVGVDGLTSVTIDCKSQDFSYRDLQEFASHLLELAGEMARIDRRRIKAEISASLTNSN